MNPISIRLLNQQLISPQFNTPEEVVHYMCAMQSQEYRMMRWAVGMRCKQPSYKLFKKAFDTGSIIRFHLMRGTWQLVSAENYWWLLELCSPKAISVTKGWMSSRVHISEKEHMLVQEILAQAAADKGSATKDDFVQALAKKNILLDKYRLSYHVRMCEMNGVLCSGNLLPMKTTYALTANKLKPRVSIDRDEALIRLTRMYFKSRQPATLEDFVWWSGLNVSDCRKGIQLSGNYLHKEKYLGREFYLTDDCRTRGFRKGKYLLIPPYDEYLISYKSRDIVLSPEYKHKAHNNSGIFQPVIAHDGIICGNWSPFKESCQSGYFMGNHAANSIHDAWLEYREYMRK
ncbi:MAG: winged helix DNA-binding domain-containing protein [Prevotella sp.]|uniref:winged helix DNA-binding domain-containing protein n=1 Tax=Prevotella sp. TaxID=59823 RepID=UPI002A2ED349|nr:winged helix DNA-binding domain-containing protein [Prevotella sp.]MDD7319185.1 winged helix DNA-binding domain-containing protein [Prevotellaceae bacterium]MDY4020053.1 winged helix DNA-binding domain-containing protein [Prevotella sp.]